jgi:type I restriction enzyme S subunit
MVRSAALVKPDRAVLSGMFLQYFLQSSAAQKQIFTSVNQGAQANLFLNHIEALRIALPPNFSEQESIAEALSDADALIESLEQLLTKKRQIKQGAMQELLTGKKRLPGFQSKPGYKQTDAGRIPEDWNAMRFSIAVQLYIDYRGRTPRKLGMSWGGGDIPALSANNVLMGRIDLEKESYFGSEELYRRWMVQGECEVSDVLITMEAPLGNIAQIPDSNKYILSQRVLLVRPKDWLSRDFLAHYMKGSSFQKQLSLNSTGSTAKGIQRKKLDALPIGIPSSLPEQTAIAAVLFDMDSAISSLETKLAKAQQLKQGMMQELLTGRIRLV